MKTSVYLSNHSITAVVGDTGGRKVKIASCYKDNIPGGLIHNGNILNAEQLAVHVGDFFNVHHLKRKNVSLVVDSESMVSKILDVPVLPPKKMIQLVRNEMTPADGDIDSLVYDYSPILSKTEEGGGRIFAVSAPRALVSNFVEMFKSAGITLGGIDITQVCAMRFFQAASEFGGRSFIYSLLDGNEMVSMLFGNDEYLFSNRTQLMEQRGTPAAAVEMSRALSSMVQFNYGRAGAPQLTNAFISGVIGEEPQFFPDISDALSIAVGSLPPTKELNSAFFLNNSLDYGDYLFCLGDVMG